MSSLRTLAAGTLVLLFVAGCSERVGGPTSGTGSAGATADGVEEVARKLAPGFELVSLSGETVRLSDLRGQTVVIDFWATWCPPCEFQVPELNAFYRAHRNDADVTVLGVSVDVEDDDVVGAWAGDKGVEYKVLVGGEDVARKYGAVGFPTLYIVAPDGTIDSMHIGLIETGDLEEALARQRGSGSG